MTNPDTSTRLLLVEDTPSLAQLYDAYLKREPYSVTHVETGKAAIEALDRDPPEIVLLDLKLPDMDGVEVLRHISAQKLPCAVIVITAHGSVNTAVECMRAGAKDFLMKPFNADRLKVTLQNVRENVQLNRLVERIKDDLDRDTYCGFIGNSLAMQAVYRIIDNAATSKATVFVTGESGTGKEVCAEAIHQRSPRAGGPFVPINCAAIPRDLMESEIFGHVKGAFTGATADRDGAARRADGGTLFLDELCFVATDTRGVIERCVRGIASTLIVAAITFAAVSPSIAARQDPFRLKPVDRVALRAIMASIDEGNFDQARDRARNSRDGALIDLVTWFTLNDRTNKAGFGVFRRFHRRT